MAHTSSPIFVLPGAGGGAPDLNLFRKNAEDRTRIEVMSYPGWKTFAAAGYSADLFIADLATAISERAPAGPIQIIGLSIGGHLGYAAALRLQAMGRQIAGLCAIDSFIVSSAAPSADWKSRAMAQGLELLFKGRLSELWGFLRSKFWRALIRLSGGRLPRLLRGISSVTWLDSALPLDPILEQELNMRLLIQHVAPWMASLDRGPLVALEAPATLLRTNLSSDSDSAWRRRCPKLTIVEIPGQHHNLFEPENVAALRRAILGATRDCRA